LVCHGRKHCCCCCNKSSHSDGSFSFKF
jgi:hypothetical protein